MVGYIYCFPISKEELEKLWVGNPSFGEYE